MNYKSHLLNNYEDLFRIKEILDTMDTNYFNLTKINEKELDNETVSIVMTICERSVQTYFTLDTIVKSSYKNVQIIIVDDSVEDILQIERLQAYDVHIEWIQIKNKFWLNPCVNYNLGFKHVKGEKIIVQNGEVCHIGDVIDYVASNIIDNVYDVFDTYALSNIEINKLLYDIPNISYDDYHRIIGLPGSWYQHRANHNLCYHFLAALSKNTLASFGGFDIDYALAVAYDDDEFIFRIRRCGINVRSIDRPYIGVHQWHMRPNGSSYSNITNQHLYNCKIHYFYENKNFLNLTSFDRNETAEIINKIF